MAESITTLSSASLLRQRAAHIRLLADRIRHKRYVGLFLATASDYEKSALELEAADERQLSASAFVTAAG